MYNQLVPKTSRNNRTERLARVAVYDGIAPRVSGG